MAIDMLKDDQKASVLNKLKEQTRPIALLKLLEGLELSYSTRAVRRWVDDWVKKGIVHKTGKKSGTRYIAIQNNLIEPAIIYFSPESIKIIKQIKTPFELRKPVVHQVRP